MSSLYFGLNVFCLFEATSRELDLLYVVPIPKLFPYYRRREFMYICRFDSTIILFIFLPTRNTLFIHVKFFILFAFLLTGFSLKVQSYQILHFMSGFVCTSKIESVVRS
jgi:hypothetical protein